MVDKNHAVAGKLVAVLTDKECQDAWRNRPEMGRRKADDPERIAYDAAWAKLGLPEHNARNCPDPGIIGVSSGDACIHACSANAIAGRLNTLYGID
jgi:hypothetical protein